jgi:hypothetical protein
MQILQILKGLAIALLAAIIPTILILLTVLYPQSTQAMPHLRDLEQVFLAATINMLLLLEHQGQSNQTTQLQKEAHQISLEQTIPTASWRQLHLRELEPGILKALLPAFLVVIIITLSENQAAKI